MALSPGRRFPWFTLSFHDPDLATEFARGLQTSFRASRKGEEESFGTDAYPPVSGYDRGVLFFSTLVFMARKFGKMTPAGCTCTTGEDRGNRVVIYMFELVEKMGSNSKKKENEIDELEMDRREKNEAIKRERAIAARSFGRNVQRGGETNVGKLTPKGAGGKAKRISPKTGKRR